VNSSVRRRRILAGVVVVTAVVTAGVVIAHRAPAPPRTGAATRTTTATRAPVTDSPQRPRTAPPLRGLAVTRGEVDLVDTGRPVVSGGATLAGERALPTELWSPGGPGPFPLVVFVHGYDTGPSDYARFCSALASSGYVVAAPSFPLEDPARGFPLDRTRLADEAGDVSFVVGSLEERAAALDLTPGAVAVVGHSDGADVALLVGYGPGTVDARVGALVADAPDPMPSGATPSSVPLLLVQGTADTVVPYSASRAVFEQVDAPVVYLSLVGAGHLPLIAGGTPWTPVLDAAVARFLDATVGHRGPGPGTLATRLADPPLATVESKP
jgi:alpha-beta hydrolase superfamily lysophospholipase